MVRQLILAAAAGSLLAPGAAWGPPSQPGPDQQDRHEDRSAAELPADIAVPDLAGRLAALSPADPTGYFLLGEEVAAEVPAAEADPGPTRSLAQHLYVLAYELDRQVQARSGADRPARGDTGRSACLALAAIEPSEVNRRWLWALARSFDPGSAGPSWSPIRARPAPDSLALDVGAVLGYARAGEGRRAETILARPGVSETLERYEGLLSPAGISGGADAIRRVIAQWPVCPECKNRRIVTKAGPGGGQTVLCHTCNGNPGPTLTPDGLLMQLRMESALLSGVQRSWAAQSVVDRGAPLRDLDPDELAPVYGVDIRLPLWRDGKWVAEPAKPVPMAPVDGQAPAEPAPASPQPSARPQPDG